MTQEKNSAFPIFPMPMRGLLLLAGMYTFAIGAFFRYFGEDLLKWLAIDNTFISANSSTVLGSISMLLGFLIFLSAFYPISWRILILIGIIGKVVAATWFVLVFVPEIGWNKRSVFHLAFNELIWLVPMILIFFRAIQVKKYLDTQSDD